MVIFLLNKLKKNVNFLCNYTYGYLQVSFSGISISVDLFGLNAPDDQIPKPLCHKQIQELITHKDMTREKNLLSSCY